MQNYLKVYADGYGMMVREKKEAEIKEGDQVKIVLEKSDGKSKSILISDDFSIRFLTNSGVSIEMKLQKLFDNKSKEKIKLFHLKANDFVNDIEVA